MGLTSRPSLRARARLFLPVLLAGAFLGACNNDSGSGGGQTGVVGEEAFKADGTSFFVDPNESGSATRVRVAELFWARLVDVHDITPGGLVNPTPAFEDFAVRESIQSDGSDYLLETSPITQKTRLVILRTRGAANSGTGTFEELLRATQTGLPPISPKNDDGTSSGPFSFIARNAVLVVRFNDLMDDSSESERNLPETLKVFTGYPPEIPFAARMLFDRNHGGFAGGEFHSSRVLIDMTVSEAEAAEMAIPQPPNAVGLPASIPTSGQPDVAIHIPTRTDFGTGQFELLTNYAGNELTTVQNGPVDLGASTRDVVRAMRSGNSTDTNNGFLLDMEDPSILGNWPSTVTSVVDDPSGTQDFDFILSILFPTTCRQAPIPGDILEAGQVFMEVVEVGNPPDQQGNVFGIHMRVLSDQPLLNSGALLGNGVYRTVYDVDSPVPVGCWVSFTPPANVFPATEVQPASQVVLSFSEPVDPAGVTPFETYMFVRGDSITAANPTASEIVVGTVRASGDLKDFTYMPTVPFSHLNGLSTPFHIEIGRATDLAGNEIVAAPSFIDFTIDPEATTQQNGGVVMRFDSDDELDPVETDPANPPILDVRGQIFLETGPGILRPRPVAVSSHAADRTNPLPAMFIPVPGGTTLPLTPFGCKLQTLWRYTDFGWTVTDESFYDLDVLGLNWSPIGGQVIADFFETFEIRVGHSRFLPDVFATASGLQIAPAFFDDNYLSLADDPPKVVHPRTLGYEINPADLFLSGTGTPMLPFPLNRTPGVDPVTYTWRDTSLLTEGEPNLIGIPQMAEQGTPTDPGFTVVGAMDPIPTFGLPLLLEFRAFPSDTAIGMNAMDYSLTTGIGFPTFRVGSFGGTDTTGSIVNKNPDLELVPDGGFNPLSTPPGAPSSATGDDGSYVGQLDTIIRVSRAHTIWIDTGLVSPDYLTPVIEPDPSQFPEGTDIILDFRGAAGFSAEAMNAPFDASLLDAYGDLPADMGTVTFSEGNVWFRDINGIDGSQYVQVRFTFVNNIMTRTTAVLSALGLVYTD